MIKKVNSGMVNFNWPKGGQNTPAKRSHFERLFHCHHTKKKSSPIIRVFIWRRRSEVTNLLFRKVDHFSIPVIHILRCYWSQTIYFLVDQRLLHRLQKGLTRWWNKRSSWSHQTLMLPVHLPRPIYIPGDQLQCTIRYRILRNEG